MAGTLLGPHHQVVCQNCAARFTASAEAADDRRFATCPNCGAHENPLAGLSALAGDRVLLDRATLYVWPPQRWDVVAFRDPQRSSRILVKRVVGLPGESIQIRQGDVYVNGQIARKPLSRTRAMALLVHDADHTPRIDNAAAPRWRAERPNVPWNSNQGRFIHPEQTGAASVDWLVYHHAGRVGNRTVPCPVMDDWPYNVALSRRAEERSPVTDLLLSFRVRRHSGRGRLVLRLTDGAERFDVWLDPDQKRFEVIRGGHSGPVAQGNLPACEDSFAIEMSLVDAQLTVAIDGRTVAQLVYEPTPDRRPDDRPVAIGVQGLGVELDRLRVDRDVYYTHPIGPRARWGLDRPARLGAEQYYVLGDNSPISEDSRTWPDGPGIEAKSLLGKPLILHFPCREIVWGRLRIQVPDLARIRYIR